MFIATNTVHLKTGYAEAFIERFNKEGKIQGMKGFVGLEILLTENTKDYEEVTILTRWENKEGFFGWMKSDAFKESHAHRGGISDFIIKNKTTFYEVKVTRGPIRV
ncbi:heme oxygenase [Alteribacillus bidgolensis]|uniref:Heme oxygenase (Staphylobilin-producing) n=1 Tax=Alteribacillus bidgolensis TaxID=930129 RepID=A0A1G8S0B3_9BACI|nr:heme oxygenase [Alteribacillus bidgolensis]SDJ22704.1 heme oxygenase (staphylobilin-producing) [Alteribacillus bidgolensis]